MTTKNLDPCAYACVNGFYSKISALMPVVVLALLVKNWAEHSISCLFLKHHLTEGLDLYDDVLTTGSEMPIGPEDEVLQTQVRRKLTKRFLGISSL